MAAEKIFSNSITLWDITTGKEIVTFNTNLKTKMESVHISEDDKHCAVLSTDKQLIIWNIEANKELSREPIGDKSIDEHFKLLSDK